MTTYSSFYITGGTLPGDAPSYIVRKADQELLDALHRSQFCYVLTARQMGKSSLMVRTANRLRQEGVTSLVLDLTAIGQNMTEAHWYDGLLNLIARQLDIEDELDAFWLAHPRLGPQQRWMLALETVVLTACKGRLVLFVDEIDAVRSLPFSADGFFAGIRECYNRRTQDAAFAGLTFCLLGVASPSDLIRDTRTTPFNIGRRIELRDFTAEEASPLAQGLGIGCRVSDVGDPSRLAEELLARVLYWTGGHPYLTQRLCQSVAEALTSGSVRSPSSVLVDRICEAEFLSDDVRNRDDNLLFVRERLLRSELDRTDLLGLYRQVWSGKHIKLDDTNPLTDVLRLSGIVRVGRGYLQVRNRIYAHVFDRTWIEAHLPDAEVRRQRQAYQLGLLRAFGFSSGALAVVIGLAVFGFMQADRANRNALKAQKYADEARKQSLEFQHLFYVANMNLIPEGFATHDIARVEDLLEQTKTSPFRGFEWGYWHRLTHLERQTLRGHTGGVYTVTLSPDGHRMLTASADHTAKIWNATTGQVVRTIGPATGIVYTGRYVDFSPDGQRILTVSEDHTVQLRNARTGRDLRTLTGHSDLVRAVAFSPDGQRIVTGSNDNSAIVWDARTGHSIFVLRGHVGPVTSVAFSPNSKRIVTGSDDSLAKVWDAITGQSLCLLKGHHSYVLSVAFSPDGKRILTGDWDETARVWNATTGREMRRIPVQGLRCAAFSPDGKRIVTGSADKTAEVWDAPTGRKLVTLMGHHGWVVSVAFSPDGKHIVTASEDHTVRVWDSFDKSSRSIPVPSRPRDYEGLALAFSPDGRCIVTGSDKQTGLVWNVATGQKRLTLTGHARPILCAAFSPDGKRIVTGSKDRSAKVWDAATGQLLLTLNGHSAEVRAVAFSPDGKRIVTGSGGATAKFWDAATGRSILILRGDDPSHEGKVASVAYSPDGKRIVTDFQNDVATVWDVATGQKILTLTGHSAYGWSVVYSPDGKRIVTGCDDHTAKVWDATTGQNILTLTGHSDPVMSVAISPDGKRIVTGSNDGTARVWDAATGRVTLTLKGHTGFVQNAVFSPDGKQIITESFDGTARVWSSD